MGDFYGYPLIANIDNDAYPEIICRENNNIVIIIMNLYLLYT